MIENPPPGQYPRYYVRQKQEHYGMAYDAEVRTDPYSKLHLGRHRSMEAADAACLHHRATGERPAPKYKQCRRALRRAHIKERVIAGGKRRYDVIGEDQTVEGQPGVTEHVGTFENKAAAREAKRVYQESGDTSKRHASRVQYPRNATNTLKGKNGRTYWQARIRINPHEVVVLTRCESKEESDQVVAEYLRTGIKPPRRQRPVRERTGSYYRRETPNGPRWDVRGRSNPGGKTQKIHIGTFDNEQEAKDVLAKFIATGYVPPKQRICTQKGRGPKPKSAPSSPRAPRTTLGKVQQTIAKGYNVRDHEFAALQKHKPELVAPGCVAKSVEQVRNKDLVGLDRMDMLRKLAARAA